MIEPSRGAAELSAILHSLGLVKAGQRIRINRIRPGRHQRARGSWSWDALDFDTRRPLNIGSQFPLSEILRAGRRGLVSVYRDSCGDRSLFPEADPAAEVAAFKRERGMGGTATAEGR